MAVKEVDWDFSKRGQEDVARHQKKVKESIRENISEVISEESIITRKKGQTVKIPIRGIKSYQFSYGNRKGGEGGGYGVGHGQRQKGDIIGRRPAPGDGEGQGAGKGNKPGDAPGEDYLETEIDMDELIAMMMDDLQLPDLRRKEVAETAIPKGWTFDNVERHGLKANIDKKRTIREAIRRSADSVAQLMAETGLAQDLCQKAFNQSRGDYHKALDLLKRGADDTAELETALGGAEDRLKPFIASQDLRYRVVKEDVEFHSNAVVLAMMDVSGSMSITKKYLARSFFFWMVEFLKHKYRHVEIRFIAHTSEAKLVEEEEFFHKGESGGTVCASAYELALHLLETEYSPSRWNVYAFHFSDGEDWDPQRTMGAVNKLVEKKINMLGYGEIRTEFIYGVQLMKSFEENFSLEKFSSYRDADFEYYLGQRMDLPFIGVVLKNKTHVYPALKAFFSKERKP